jgi:hypothetical protein
MTELVRFPSSELFLAVCLGPPELVFGIFADFSGFEDQYDYVMHLVLDLYER